MQKADELLELWDFNWGVMNVMIGGNSAIDLDNIKVKDYQDATDFLTYYGFNPDNASDARFTHAAYVESLHFIAIHLMPREWQKGRRPPPEFLELEDMRQILLWAADTSREKALYQAWACAILRVMHTITHIDGIRRHAEIDTARDQILGRLEKFFFKGQNGELRFGSQERSIPLHKVEWKREKRRESIVIKLLHKRGNVAETIYDLLGVRIVTQRLSDVMVAVKLLRDLYMITFPNCNPGRARNTLLDTEHFKLNIDVLRSMLKESRISALEFSNLVERVVVPIEQEAGPSASNPHSAASYRSVQLTCRQLICGPDPETKWQEKIRAFIDAAGADTEIKKLAGEMLAYSKLFQNHETNPKHAYFPFEIHILDRDAYKSNKRGSASHGRYKSSQIKAARRRVLGTVLTYKAPSAKKAKKSAT